MAKLDNCGLRAVVELGFFRAKKKDITIFFQIKTILNCIPIFSNCIVSSVYFYYLEGIRLVPNTVGR